MAFEFDHDEPPHLNFRTFVNALEADGDIANIHKECDPYLEVAAITRYANENRLEAPLFHNVKGAKGGLFRILGSPGCYRQHTAKDKYGRIARHLALPPTATMKEITERLVCGSDETPVDPVSVDAGSAPCKEMKVNDVDLEALPSPQIHLADGGRYIQTYGIHIVKSPDGKWENWAVSRAMIHDKTHLVTAMIWPQHLWKIKEMWKALGKDCPWALAIGVPPAALMAGAAPLADGVSEPGYIGAMTGSPLKVVKCETNDLMVPVSSFTTEFVEKPVITTQTDCLADTRSNTPRQILKLSSRERSTSTLREMRDHWERCTATTPSANPIKSRWSPSGQLPTAKMQSCLCAFRAGQATKVIPSRAHVLPQQ